MLKDTLRQQNTDKEIADAKAMKDLYGRIWDYFPLFRVLSPNGVSLSNIPLVRNDYFPTAATDGKKIIYSQKFMDGLKNDEERIFVLAHEAMHVLLNHIYRVKDRDPQVWNIATDAVINQMLKANNLPMIDGCVNIPEAFKRSANEMYDKLLKEKQQHQQQKQQQQGQQGQQGQQAGQNQQGQQGQQGGQAGQGQQSQQGQQGQQGQQSQQGQQGGQNQQGNQQGQQQGGQEGQQGQNGQSQGAQQDKDDFPPDWNSGIDWDNAQEQAGFDDHDIWKKAAEEHEREEEEKKKAEERKKKIEKLKDKFKKVFGKKDEQKQDENQDASGDSQSDDQNAEDDKQSDGADGTDDKPEENPNDLQTEGQDGQKDEQKTDQPTQKENKPAPKKEDKSDEQPEEDDDENTDEETDEEENEQEEAERPDQKSDSKQWGGHSEASGKLRKIDRKEDEEIDAFERGFFVKNEKLREKIEKYEEEETAKNVRRMERKAARFAEKRKAEREKAGLGQPARPVLNWRQVLRRTLEKEEELWSRRRVGRNDMSRVEAMDKYEAPDTEVMLDTSGSVSGEFVKEFLRQLKPLLKIGSHLKVGCFDDEFYGFTEIKTNADIDNFQVRGGGGTDFGPPVANFTRKKQVNKLIFTDGQAYPVDPPDPAVSNVIWLIYDPDFCDRCPDLMPKFGKIVLVNPEKIEENINNTSFLAKGKGSR